MALTDLLGSALRGAALGLAMYVAGCGGENINQRLCQSNYDCQVPSMCGVDGYCEDSNGGEEGNSNGACGNSPLVGKYLWMVDDCGMGTIDPLNISCQGILVAANGERGDIDYSGLTLRIGTDDSGLLLRAGRKMGGSSVTLELLRMVTESDLPPPSTVNSDRCGPHNYNLNLYQCFLSHSQQLYLTFTPEIGKSCPGFPIFFEVKDEPWPGLDACIKTLSNEAWYTECSSQEN